jgi:hypothetical protein
MNDKFISYDDINRDMKQIEELGAVLAERLALLEKTLVYIFAQIKESDDGEAMQGYFECLDRIQLCLALLVCQESISISDRLHRFMKDFDNFEQAKEYYFEKIRNGEYTF